MNSTTTYKGFTLAELIVVIAILAIIATYAMPYFENHRAQQEANQVLKQLPALIQYAKNEAVLRRMNIVICSSDNLTSCKNNEWNKYVIVFVDQNKNRQIDSNDLILNVTEFNLKYANLNWKASLNSPVIVFGHQTGLPIGYNGSFYYCATRENLNQRILLSKMGQVRNEPPNPCLT